MSNSPSTPFSKEGSPQLQRGKACLSCRRRKMRCDGARPYCTQCVRGNRAEDCEYTDNQGRTRTQILEENIAILQARVEELEGPTSGAQSVLLRDPYEAYRQANPRVGTSENAGGSSNLALAIPSRPGSAPTVMSWWEFEEPPAQITDMLVNTFLPHATSLGFALSITRFRRALRLPTLHPSRPHPALLHTIFLWALRLSRTPELMQHESLYLQRAILALQDALGGSPDLDAPSLAQRRVHAMQAEVLLARYFFSLGRLLEGRYHANAAVSLAVSCGLHRTTLDSVRAISSSPLPSSRIATQLSVGSASLFELAPARDTLELGERIRVFWEVYNADRCWSAALGVPCVLADEAVLGTQIDTPWPQDIEKYEQTTNPSISPGETRTKTVQRFLSNDSAQSQPPRDDSRATLRAKASALYERAARLMSLWDAAAPQSQTQARILEDMRILAQLITQFARGLVPPDQSAAPVIEYLVIHGLVHAAMIILHSARASVAPAGDMSATNSALTHAHEALKVVEKATALEGNSSLLDPILSIIGLSAAQVFVLELSRMQNLQATTPSTRNRIEALRANVDRVIEALRLGAGCPIFAQQIPKIEDLLRNL
ncbi:hypothetical protein M0805_009862 [Coniferiporia weirii]|nr:hypothetical protein M0805_009862 [Coniferiporia weirii]